MSCTIDHLRIDLIATVRQEFTDARGGRHRSGESKEPPPPPPSPRPPRRALPVPELAAEPITDAGRYDEGFARVRALVARARFAEAETQLLAILHGPDPGGCRLHQTAEQMVEAALAHAFDPNDPIYEWARDRAVHLWYAWGAQATSGGDGAARLPSIHAAEDRLAACDAKRG